MPQKFLHPGGRIRLRRMYNLVNRMRTTVFRSPYGVIRSQNSSNPHPLRNGIVVEFPFINRHFPVFRIAQSDAERHSGGKRENPLFRLFEGIARFRNVAHGDENGESTVYSKKGEGCFVNASPNTNLIFPKTAIPAVIYKINKGINEFETKIETKIINSNINIEGF